MKIEFVSYTGEYPNLCHGELTLRIDGEEKIFGFDFDKYPGTWKEQLEIAKSHYERFWSSGGCIRASSDYSNMWAESGPWELDKDSLPDELKPYGQELINIFNENVPWGCCGGCI